MTGLPLLLMTQFCDGCKINEVRENLHTSKIRVHTDSTEAAGKCPGTRGITGEKVYSLPRNYLALLQ